MRDNINELINADITKRLSEHRLHHSFCVAESARELSIKYGGEPETMYTAGLAHDVLKELKKEEFDAFFAAEKIELTAVEKSAPKLWHAIAAARYLEKQYSLHGDIIRAVRYHTTGRAGMTTAEKILFIADFISADRDYDGVEDMRERAERSLEEAMEEGLRFTIAELAAANRPIHPDTVAAYNEILTEGHKNG